jgi:hypothetical protein
MSVHHRSDMFQFIWLCHDKISKVEVPHQTFVQENGVAKGYADILRDSSADLGIVCLWGIEFLQRSVLHVLVVNHQI